MRSLRALLQHVPILAVAACGGGDLVLPSDAGPTSITIVDGDGQTGNAGAGLPDPLVVRVTDGQDRAARDLQVVFTLADEEAGGDVNPDTAVTDGDGLARAEWVLGGAAGAQAVDARIAGSTLSVRFTAEAGSGAAAGMVAAAGDGQSAAVGTALPDSLAVAVADQFGNPVAGVEVTWSVGEGEVSPASVVSGADGRAAARRILGSTAGEQTATAAAEGLEGSPVTFTHTAVPGSAATLVLVSGSDQSGPPGEELPDPAVVRVVDESGNGIPGQPVAWILATANGGSVDPETDLTDDDGYASTRWTLAPVQGTNTLNAVVSGVGVVVFTATGTDGGGGGDGDGEPSPNRSTVSADPTSIQAGTGTATITVTVRDASGDPVSGASVTLAATGSGNTLIQPDGATGADGVATGRLSSTVPGTKEVSATVNGAVELNQRARVTVSLAPASRVELVEGDDQTAPAGSAVPVRPAVRVVNDLGQPVAGFGVTFEVTGGGGSVQGASQTTNSSGIARADSWVLGPAPGANTLAARAGSLDGSPVLFTAEATGAGGDDASGFRFLTQPPDVEEDEPFTVQVALVDAVGETVPLSGVEIRLELFREGRSQPDNNRLDGEEVQPTVNGVAVFTDLRVDNDDENYRLRARSDDLPDLEMVFSEPFDVED